MKSYCSSERGGQVFLPPSGSALAHFNDSVILLCPPWFSGLAGDGPSYLYVQRTSPTAIPAGGQE